MRVLLLVGLMAGWASAMAEDLQIWNTELELGLVATSGNTDDQNLKLRADSQGDFADFRHHLHLDYLRSSKDGSTTAQKLYGFYQADYKLLDETSSIFGRASYDDDRFSGFKYQSELTAGYSRQLLDSEVMTLSGDVGLGLRVTGLDTGEKEDEGIIRLAGKYTWLVSDNSAFQQLLSTEIGTDTTVSRSDSSITATINSRLSMKLALTVKHNSEVPVDRKNTDTETSVTLVYGF